MTEALRWTDSPYKDSYKRVFYLPDYTTYFSGRLKSTKETRIYLA